MQCRVCDYALWNLPTRNCPECGTPFKPSEYEFVCNSVQFCCPNCDQPYYGTGERGHLVPPEFACVTCGRDCHIDEMVLRPTEGVSESQTRTETNPWAERQRTGIVSAWFRTIGRSLVQPGSLGRTSVNDTSTWDAWWFAILTVIIITVGGVGVPGLVWLAFSITPGGGGGLGADELFLIAFVILIFPAQNLLGGLIWAGLAHLVLKISGGAPRGFNNTLKPVLYTSGTMALIAVPCIGPYCAGQFMWVWWIVSACLAVAAAQGVHGGRATLAVLTPVLLSVILSIAAYALIMVSIFAGMGSMSPVTSGAFASTGPAAQTRVLNATLRSVAMNRNGAPPAHALELLTASRSVGVFDFVTSSSATMLADIPVDSITLDNFNRLGNAQRTTAIQNEIASLPPDLTAHRVGDFVFTWHGIDFNDHAMRMLWTIVQIDDPEANIFPNDPITIGLVDGSTFTISAAAFAADLRTQNTERQALGLPPLPDLTTLKHHRASNPPTP